MGFSVVLWLRGARSRGVSFLATVMERGSVAFNDWDSLGGNHIVVSYLIDYTGGFRSIDYSRVDLGVSWGCTQ